MSKEERKERQRNRVRHKGGEMQAGEERRQEQEERHRCKGKHAKNPHHRGLNNGSHQGMKRIHEHQ